MNHHDLYLITTIDVECDKTATWYTITPLSFRGITEVIPNLLLPLFADFGIRPTFLPSPEVICNPDCCSVLRDADSAELGTHLHGDYTTPQIKTWDFAGSITDEMQWEYPPDLERAKLETIFSI